jgi:hypothetical protein
VAADTSGFCVSLAEGASCEAAGVPKKENTGSFFLAGSLGAGGRGRGRLDGGLGRGLNKRLDDGLDGDLFLRRNDGLGLGLVAVAEVAEGPPGGSNAFLLDLPNIDLRHMLMRCARRSWI